MATPRPIPLFAGLLLTLVGAVPAATQGCPTIDLTVPARRGMRVTVPPTDQASLGICYAESAAGLLSAATKRDISAVHLMLEYADAAREVTTTPYSPVPYGGNELATLQSVLSLGWVATNACLNGRDPDYDGALNTYYNDVIAGRVPRYQDIPQRVCAAAREQRVGAGEVRSMSVHRSDMIDSATRTLASAVRSYCRGPGTSASLDSIRACGYTRHPYHRRDPAMAARTFKNAVAYALATESPAIIDVNLSDLSPEGTGSGHSMLVTGQRAISDRCYFIIRNWWGDRPCYNGWSSRGILCSGHGLPADSLAMPVDLAGSALQSVTFAENIRSAPARPQAMPPSLGASSPSPRGSAPPRPSPAPPPSLVAAPPSRSSPPPEPPDTVRPARPLALECVE